MSTVAIFSLYPKQATRVKLEALSLKKAGYNVRIISPNSFSYLPSSLRVLFVYLHFFLLTLTVKADVYHYSNIPDFQALSFLLRKNAIFIYDVRSVFSSNIYEYSKKMIFSRLIYNLEVLITKRADYVITANSFLENRAKRMGATKTGTVPNYPLKKMAIDIQRDDLRSAYGIKSNDIVYLIISTLTPQKPFDLLFEKFNQLIKEKRNVRLWIIGDGKDRQRLEKHADEEFYTFFGYKPINKLGKYINASDVCLALYSKQNPKVLGYYSVESVWKVSEYALFDKPIVALNMLPHKGLINANQNNLIEKLIEAVDSSVRLKPHFWEESHNKLIEIYSELID